MNIVGGSNKLLECGSSKRKEKEQQQGNYETDPVFHSMTSLATPRTPAMIAETASANRASLVKESVSLVIPIARVTRNVLPNVVAALTTCRLKS